MTTTVEQLVDTLLWEGYALYPYTPHANKNATPTPFGIVYPPVYAAPAPTTFDEIRMPTIAEGGDGVSLELHFLRASGVRHEATAHRHELGPVAHGQSAAASFDADGCLVRVELRSEPLGNGLHRVVARVANLTPCDPDLTRSEALAHSLLSTHLVVRVHGGTFASPTAPPERMSGAQMTCVAVNTFPVLASEDDDAILGAAIILPDHPQIAPESKGSLFDSTEIEETLRLHLLALTDEERAELQDHDPALREMLERAIEAAPGDLATLHGRITVGDVTASIAGGTVTRGDRVRLRPDRDRHAQDHLLDGRTATIERIYRDFDDRVHLCVTVDDDPGQQLMREIGRYLYFKTTEVEAL